MNKNIKISVIIATYNGYRYIKQAINSVLNQTFNDFELIVVDDGSDSKKTIEILSSYKSRGLIKYIKRENGGPGAARNTGINIALGKYIAFLDDDDYWSSNKLEKQFNLISDTDNIVCYTDSFVISPYGEIKEKTRKYYSGELYNGDISNKIILNNFITLSSVLVRKDVLEKIDYFSENLKFFMLEDYDLWLRLSLIGKFCCVDEPLTFYRTRLPLDRDKKIFEYKKLITLLKNNTENRNLKHKMFLVFRIFICYLKVFYFLFSNFLSRR